MKKDAFAQAGLPAPAPSALPTLELPWAPLADLPARSEHTMESSVQVSIPHVLAWNLTRRCNLACSHCYISAGSWENQATELDTAQCLSILDDVLEVNPSVFLILSGGEPLVREDLETIAAHATKAGATVVVGTNGIGLTQERIQSLKAAGVQGVAVSVDSLNPTYHDRFRHGAGALSDTLAAVDRCVEGELDFVIQTTLTKGNAAEIPELVSWAAAKGAVSFNLYFLVPTGRGQAMQGLAPEENERVLAQLVELEHSYRGRMMIRSKCQPQFMRHIFEAGHDSPLLNYRTRCPCGVQYCRITPEGKLTPCPYMPAVAGDLTRESFRDVWEKAALFQTLRHGSLGGRCGRCEYREVCGGCRARAYAQSGDPLGPDDSCLYDPSGELPVVNAGPETTYGSAAEPSLPWTAEAEQRLAKIPSFVRGVVTKRVEGFARERGHTQVDLDVMAEVRQTMPVDFSKRLPFFLKREAAANADSSPSERGDA